MKGLLNWMKNVWQRSMLHRAMLVAPPVALLLLGAFVTVNSRNSVQYYTAKVEKGDISQVVQATGTINAVITVQVGSQVSGQIQKLSVDFNSHVTKGQVIAQIDPANFRARLMQAEADLQDAQANVNSLAAQIEVQRADVLASKANVAKAQAQLDDATTQLRRTKELANEGIFAAAQRDTAQATYDGALANLHVTEAQAVQSGAKLKSMIAQLDQAKAQVQMKRAAAESSRLDLEHTTIYAPIDGTVIARNVDVGQTVAASLQAPTLFIIAQDLTKMLVYAKTDEADVGRIKPGAMATFRVDSFPRETFRGRVQQVRMNATMVQNVVTYDTIVEFANPEQKLFPGMTAYVTIPVAWESDVVKIPNGALRFKPEMSDAERKVLFAKYNISEQAPSGGRRLSGMGGAAKAAGGGAEGAAGNDTGAAIRRRPGGESMGGPGGASTREDYGIVWKLLPDKSLMPVRARLGVTDFTFTAMREGNLQPGDVLVIGQASKTTTAQQTQQRGPMSPGIPRRM